jgi:hypothetical protein
MSSLLLVGNPAKHRKHHKPRSAAQKAATRKLVAHNRAKRANPARRAKRRHNPIAANPVHHKRRRHATRHNPIRARRRNPATRATMSGITAQLKAAGMGAVGALGVDVVTGYAAAYLPATVATPVDTAGATQYGYFAAKGAIAIGLGLLLKKMVGAAKANQLVEGSLTVTLHELGKTIIATNAPSISMGRYVGMAGARQLGPMQPIRGLPSNVRSMGAYVGTPSRARQFAQH